jgi:hypothetical protein
MVLKYVVPSYPFPTLWFGVANVIANVLISLRCVAALTCRFESLLGLTMGCSSVVLWVSQNMEDDYTYNLQL